MKISFKTIKNTKFQIEVTDLTKPIKDLCSEIEKMQGLEKNSLKLILNGKLMEMENPIKFYKIKETDQVILLPIKATPLNITEKIEVEKLNINPENKENFQKYKRMIIKMGYTSEEAESALIENNGDLDKAIVFLEENEVDFHSDHFSFTSDSDSESDSDGYFDVTETKLVEIISSIVKVMMNKDFSLFDEMLKKVSEEHSQFLNIVAQNYDEIKVLSAQPITHEDKVLYNDFQRVDRFDLIKVEEDCLKHNSNKFNESEEQELEILESTGFSREECEEAFMACGKDVKKAKKKLFGKIRKQ